MNKNIALKASILTATIALFTGCATVGGKDFSCPAPKGFVCKSPTEIYELTHGDTAAVYDNTPSQESSDGMFKSKNKSSSNGSSNGNTVPVANQFSKPAYLPNSNPMPVLEQPQVLRVWVASWVDENQTLNFPSYKFKEVTPRKWNFGGAQVFRNSLPVTAPDNAADYQSPSTETSPSMPQGSQLPAGIQKQNDMVGQAGMGTADFHNDQSPNGLPVDGAN